MSKRTKTNKRDTALRQFLENKKSPTKKKTVFVTGYNRGWEDCRKHLDRKWRETCEIMANPEILNGLRNALEDFNKGRFTVITNKIKKDKIFREKTL